MSRLQRIWFLYEDEGGYSEVKNQIATISRSDRKKGQLIMKKIGLLEHMSIEDAQRSKLIKRPPGSIFILRANDYRLPFFEDPCAREPTIIFTACVKRAFLDRRGAYSSLIEKAEAFRAEWVARHC